VINAYRFILGRDPENDEVIAHHIRACKNISELRDSFFRSEEFLATTPMRIKREATGGDIAEFKLDMGFYLDCCFPPYNVEYKSTAENTNKMIAHIGEIWGNYGKDETYWSVLVADSFLKKNLSKENIDEFYETGKETLRQIENTLKRCGEWEKLNYLDCMEYGCGVGRVTIQLANLFKNVTGLDISTGHLELARRRIDAVGIKNIKLQRVHSLDEIEKLPKYDFIFTVIVLQHNPPPIIAIIIENFFKLLKNSGIVMFQVPVQMRGYSFSVSDYLENMNKYGMEMHMLQQNIILKIACENKCYPLDIHCDGWIGIQNDWISQTFVFKKME
jgi:2-polyprenyl-3-methyl-5-hydroxy-6-metoxy-1,4-benzoquinol methylase